MGFLKSIAKVARVAAGVAEAIVNEISITEGSADGGQASFNLSGVEFVYDSTDNKIYAIPTECGLEDVNATYSRTGTDGSYTAYTQTMSYGHYYDATPDLSDYADGEVNVSVPTANGGTQSTDLEGGTVASLFWTIATFFTAKIIISQKMSFAVTETGFVFTADPIPVNLTVSYTDNDGTVYNLEHRFSNRKLGSV